MEITLEVADESRVPSYLSVRASGSRKICSVKPGQHISFADLSAPGKVKVEVLEQVGVVTLPSDFPAQTKVAVPRSSGRPVEINCRRTGPQKNSSTVSLPPVPDAETLDRSEPLDQERAAAAQRKYLEEAGVDELVEEVVRELLLHQPKDPRTFLRQHYAGYPADPSKLTSALGDACNELQQWASMYRKAGVEYEREFTPDMRDAIDLKTQEAAWWKLKCQQQFDAVGELENLNQKADAADANRRAAEAAATAAEAELREQKAKDGRSIAALEREVARLSDTVQRQAAEIARANSEMNARVLAVRQAAEESYGATKRRCAQVEFQLKASVRSGVQLQSRCRRLKERLRQVSGDTTLEPDSDSEDPVAPPLDSLAMSQDSFQFSGDIAGMSPPRPVESPSPKIPPLAIDKARPYADI